MCVCSFGGWAGFTGWACGVGGGGCVFVTCWVGEVMDVDD